MKSRCSKTLIICGSSIKGAHEVPRLHVHIAQQLLEAGRFVTVLSKNASLDAILPNGVCHVVGDFSQHVLICSLLDEHQEVIYLSYTASTNDSNKGPIEELLLNLAPSVQLFAESAIRGIKVVLVSSGSSVYGNANYLPINEAHPTKPISNYGVSKLTLENYAYLYASAYELKFVCVRPSNVYGVGQYPYVGQGFVSTAIASAIKGFPIKIFGERGTVRDYIYISDLASGIVSALLQGRLSETYNIATGVGLSNLDIIEVLKPLMHEIGCNVTIDHLPKQTSDVMDNVLDCKKLTTDTGWSPKVSLIDGLRQTCKWLEILEQ